MKNFLHNLALIVLLGAMVFGAAYFHWWRCGEMFPNAQFACFVGGK